MHQAAQTTCVESHQRTNLLKPNKTLILQLATPCIYTFVHVSTLYELPTCAADRLIPKALKILWWHSAEQKKESHLRSPHFHIENHAFGSPILQSDRREIL